MLTQKLYRTFFVVALVITLVYMAKSVVMPIIFSAFVAMFCHPLVRRFEGYGVPFLLSIFIVVLGVFLIFLGALTLFSVEGVQIAREIPKTEFNMNVNFESALNNPRQTFEDSPYGEFSRYYEELRNLVIQVRDSIISLLPKTLASVSNLLIFLGTVPVYIFFMLLARKQLRGFYYNCFPERERIIARRVLTQIERVLREFLKGMGIAVLIIATLITIGLYAMGVEHAIFFGLLAGFLTIVPYLGVIISAALPAALVFITKDSYWYPIGVIAIFGAVQWLEGNVITPKIMSDQVGLNPLAVIIGLVIFGSLGGLLGVLITTPTLAIFKTISYYVPSWKPLKKFLQV